MANEFYLVFKSYLQNNLFPVLDFRELVLRDFFGLTCGMVTNWILFHLFPPELANFTVLELHLLKVVVKSFHYCVTG